MFNHDAREQEQLVTKMPFTQCSQIVINQNVHWPTLCYLIYLLLLLESRSHWSKWKRLMKELGHCNINIVIAHIHFYMYAPLLNKHDSILRLQKQLINGVTYRFDHCLCMEQPSWILNLGYGAFLRSWNMKLLITSHLRWTQVKNAENKHLLKYCCC